MPGVAGEAFTRRVPFSSPGARSGKTRLPCVCAASVVLTAPGAEIRVKGSSSTSLPKSLGANPLTAGFAPRVEANNIVLAQTGSGQGITASTCQEQAQPSTRPKRGRPKGYTAWNKGKYMPASLKEQISKTQKQRWKQRPELHALVSSKLKGIEPWNKGRTMRPETCQKMSAAKQGCTIPRAVRAKISQARTGQMHSEATRVKMSASRVGMTMPLETKARIAATQRRRHAASRILKAVEAFHRDSDFSFMPEKHHSVASGSNPMRKKRRVVKCLSGHVPGGKPASKAQIMAAYKAQLREYRLLQEELGPWTQAFKAQHGRKPCLSDVERTGIDWLMSKFKAYMILRDRLLTDTSILRDKLDVAVPDFANGAPPAAKMASYATKLNANAASAKRTRSAGTVSAALEYRRQQQALAETAAISAAADTAAGAAAAAIVEAAAQADDAGREAVRMATANLKQLHVSSTQRHQHPTVQNGQVLKRAQAVEHGTSNGAQQASASANGRAPTESPGHKQTAGSSDNMYKTAGEAASDSKANVSTASGIQSQSDSYAGQNGSNGAASKANGRTPTTEHSASLADNRAEQSEVLSRKPDKGTQPVIRRKHIPTPLSNTSPRIKSALLAAEEYRKQKAAKTAALALAAANAAANRE